MNKENLKNREENEKNKSNLKTLVLGRRLAADKLITNDWLKTWCNYYNKEWYGYETINKPDEFLENFIVKNGNKLATISISCREYAIALIRAIHIRKEKNINIKARL